LAETRVDLLHLLEDLRDAYPGALEETILTEVIANSLDSGATLIRIFTSPAGASFTIVDNGSGMPAATCAVITISRRAARRVGRA